MKKLGIDLGSSSLGWVINEDGKIIKKGVITFNSGMLKGQSGGYNSPTRERREARSKRNLIRSRKYRKWALLGVLLNEFVPLNKTELEIWTKYSKGRINKFPENEKFKKWLACDFTYEGGQKYNNPYELRIKALDEQMSKHEFGRALYHLVQRRGYKDIGETDSETQKQIEKRGGESGFQKALDSHRTIAEALVKEFLDKGRRARNQYPYRDEYRNELEQICRGQGYDISKDTNGNYIDNFIEQLWNSIIWQRPLRTQKGNIGKCTFEPKKLRCPISHPIFEIFRTWQFINTIKYFDEQGNKQTLSKEIKKQLFDWFLKKEGNFKFEEIRKFLNNHFETEKKYNYPTDKDGIYDTSVAGMPICKGLISIFGDKAQSALSDIEQYNNSNAPKIINQYSVYDLWHILFSYDKRNTANPNFLEDFAIEKLDVANTFRKKAGKDVSVNLFAELQSKFLQGYAELSLKAMCKIIPFLKAGYLYNESVVLAKIPELLGEDWEIHKEKIVAIVKESNKLYEWNKLIIGITNKLIEKYKGLDDDEQFAYKNYQYILDESDIEDIKTACSGYFGEKSWSELPDKNEIINSVKLEYQAFFNDIRRDYRELLPLTQIFNEKLKENHIKINGDLYHHSNRENIFNKNLKVDRKIGERFLPKYKTTTIEILPNPQIDSIKNPMFNKSMSILKKLINELIVNADIDPDTEVIVELARELNDNNKRIAIERYQNERKNNREKYRLFLQEFKENQKIEFNVEESIPTFELWTEQIFQDAEDENKQKIKNKDRIEILKEKDAVKRYELWIEQKGQCMYTGKVISLTKLFSNEIDIEHTIPQSLLPDNTMANQTIAYAWYNRDKKGKKLPTHCENYNKDVEGWGTSIERRLTAWKQIRDNFKSRFSEREKAKGNEDENTKNKRIQEKHYFKMHFDYWNDKIQRFETSEVKDNWARRQLADTQTVSKYAREYLKLYFKKVAVQKGTVTADFRKLYGFQPEDEIKSRNRHTHHAIDAAVLTLIPVNSSKRDEIIKQKNNYYEKHGKQLNLKPYPNFNSQKIINDIETTTLIVNYEKDKILQQTKKTVRKRGKIQYVKDKQGKFILNKDKKKIPLIAKGDTVRSELYAQTYLGKIRDVERDEYEKIIDIEKLNIKLRIKGFPVRENKDWKFKTGKDEYCFVKRENIDKVKTSDSSIDSIIDPVIRELVRKQKNNAEIKDYQGNVIRHVRIKTKAGKEVKNRVNYLSEHEYKNKFYSEAGSIPYAILLQKINNDKIEREMIPVASYEIAKMHKKTDKFDIETYIHKTYPEYSNWNKKLVKTGQKVFVLMNDNEFDNRKNVNFQINRMYVISQFSEGSIWLNYHLNALSKDDVKKSISLIKDKLLRKYEIELNLPNIEEDSTIIDTNTRKKDYDNRRFRFDTINNSYRLRRIFEIVGEEKTKEIKNFLDKYKAIPSKIEVEGETSLLKTSKENWNFLYEGYDFKINIDGTIKFSY